MSDLCDLTIAEAGRLIARRQLSSAELTTAFLQRIERYDPVYRAYVTVTADAALNTARRLDQEMRNRGARGPLHGIPLALKDVIKTKGVRTTAGSRTLATYVPSDDAWVWSRLANAGAVLLGKLETHEFANGGPLRRSDRPYDFNALNPWNTTRYTGGSSSGSACAMAAGLCMGTVGTDTGGSIRIPAAYCGVFGFKPSFGAVSRQGVLPVSWSLDQCGPITRSVEDAAIMLDGMTGYDPADPSMASTGAAGGHAAALSEDIGGMRIGFVRHFATEDLGVDVEVVEAVERALDVFSGLGTSVRDIRLPPLRDFTAANTIVLLAECYAIHARRLSASYDDYGEQTRERIALGAFISAADYLNAQKFRKKLLERYLEALGDVDIIVSACTPSVAPDAEEVLQRVQRFFIVRAPVLTAPFNATGAPAASIQCGFGSRGLPIGMQIAARPGDDDAVLRAAFAYERATPWRNHRPTLVSEAERPSAPA